MQEQKWLSEGSGGLSRRMRSDGSVEGWPLVQAVTLKGPCLFSHSPAARKSPATSQIPNISISWDVDQPKLFRTPWPVRAKFPVASEGKCRILASVCREESGAVTHMEWI